MHTVSLFGHFETWDRVAFKWEGCSKYIQNDLNQIQTKQRTLSLSSAPFPQTPFHSPPPSGIWGHDEKLFHLKGFWESFWGEYMFSPHMEMNKCACQFPKEEVVLQPWLGLEPVGAKISMLPLLHSRAFRLFPGQDAAGKLWFVFLIKLVSSELSFGVLDVM